jgi:uncharacterized protein (UPF0212 family)
MEAVSPEFIEDAPRPVRRRVGDLPAPAWLDLWERGRGQTSAQRALAWLEAARLEDQDDPAFWTIAERDAQILFLRESAFGLEMEGSAHCPRCGERLELQFTTREILPRAETSGGHIAVELDDCAVRFRLPVAGDLANLSAFTPDAARNELLATCFLDGQRAGITLAFKEVPEAIRAAVEEEMARRDPYAHTELALNCPACGQAWNQAFDAASFLGTELEAWARRTLNEVHVLASVYGWTESEILQLSPARRQLYLSLFGT